MVPATEVPIEDWFKNEIFKWRCGASMWWTAIFGIATSILYTLVCYLLTFTDHFGARFTGCLIIFVLFTNTLHVIVTLYNTSTCTVVPRVSVTRLGNVVAFFKPKYLVQCVSFMILNTFITISAFWITKPSLGSFSIPCLENGETFCLNEYAVFLVVLANYQGLLYHLHYYINQYEYTHYLIIQQPKFFHIKSQLFPVFIESFKIVFYQQIVYYPLYYFLGYLPRDLSSKVSGLELTLFVMEPILTGKLHQTQ